MNDPDSTLEGHVDGHFGFDDGVHGGESEWGWSLMVLVRFVEMR